MDHQHAHVRAAATQGAVCKMNKERPPLKLVYEAADWDP
jgi:hypothetical protein